MEFWKLPVRFITKTFLLVAERFSKRWRTQASIKDAMLTAGLRMRDSAQLQLY